MEWQASVYLARDLAECDGRLHARQIDLDLNGTFVQSPIKVPRLIWRSLTTGSKVVVIVVIVVIESLVLLLLVGLSRSGRGGLSLLLLLLSLSLDLLMHVVGPFPGEFGRRGCLVVRLEVSVPKATAPPSTTRSKRPEPITAGAVAGVMHEESTPIGNKAWILGAPFLIFLVFPLPPLVRRHVLLRFLSLHLLLRRLLRFPVHRLLFLFLLHFRLHRGRSRRSLVPDLDAHRLPVRNRRLASHILEIHRLDLISVRCNPIPHQIRIRPLFTSRLLHRRPSPLTIGRILEFIVALVITAPFFFTQAGIIAVSVVRCHCFGIVVFLVSVTGAAAREPGGFTAGGFGGWYSGRGGRRVGSGRHARLRRRLAYRSE